MVLAGEQTTGGGLLLLLGSPLLPLYRQLSSLPLLINRGAADEPALESIAPLLQLLEEE